MRVFTAEQVEALNAYQVEGKYHPFTCGNQHDEQRDVVAVDESGRRFDIVAVGEAEDIRVRLVVREVTAA